MSLTRKVATELAREGLKLRKEAMVNGKSANIGVILEGDDFYVCTEEEYYYAIMPIALLNVRYDDTIKAIADKIYDLKR